MGVGSVGPEWEGKGRGYTEKCRKGGMQVIRLLLVMLYDPNKTHRRYGREISKRNFYKSS
jgi:hypothetical protein